MKHIFFKLISFLTLFTLTYSSVLRAKAKNIQEKTFQIFVNDQKGKLVKKNVVIANLESDKAFSGKYFDIVLGTDNRPIEFDSTNATRAAQVYYHLSIARNYFLKLKGANTDHLNTKIKIRIDMPNEFDPFCHFSKREDTFNFNTAITIPASNENRNLRCKEWGDEIWFRPMLEVKDSKSLNQIANALESSEFRRQRTVSLVSNSLSQSVSRGLSKELLGSLSSKQNLIFLGAGLITLRVLPKILKLAGKVAKRKFFLDTSMIPEIVYHEYAHYALADHVPLVSTPVTEGLANFYAGKIANKPKWGKKPREFSRDRGKNPKGKLTYSRELEYNMFAISNFVYQLLWNLEEKVKTQWEDKVYILRRNIKEESDIKYDLVNELFLTLKVDPKLNKLNNKMSLHQYFQQLGL